MATEYSNEVSVGTWNRIRLKVDYSGTSATCTIQFKRTAPRTDSWSDSLATLTFNGQEKAAPYSHVGYVGTDWIDIKTVSGYTITGAAQTYNWRFNNPQSASVLGCSGSISLDATTTKPSGWGASVNTAETKWNSIKGTASITSWGTPSTGSEVQFIVNKVSGTWGDRFAYKVASGNTMSGSKACTTANADWTSSSTLATTWPIKGCMDFYYGVWANNSGNASDGKIFTTLAHTPPSPLTAFSKSDPTASTAGKVKYTFTMTGGTSGSGNTGNNYAVNVENKYRYSTNGGSSYTGWENVGSSLTSATKTFTLELPEGSSSIVQVCQVYNGLYSEPKQLSFTVPVYYKAYGSVSGKAVKFKKGYVSVNGKAVAIKKVYASVNGKAKRVF